MATFEDGQVLFAAVRERGLEGVDARAGSIQAGQDGWGKNQASAQFAEERQR